MAQFGVNNEPLHERLIFAYDGSDYRVVKVDTDGNLVVALKATEDVQANSYGWVGSAWQKDPIRIGYSSTVAESKEDLNLAGGTVDLDGTAVSSGEIWTITATAVRYDGTSPTFIRVQAVISGVGAILLEQPTPTSGQWYTSGAQVLMGANDYIRATVVGSTAGDNLRLRYAGYKSDIDQ